ncbi:acetyltransferase [Pseudomonas sp. SDI]|uniref:NeuD/PglB/VioB family sugar acetyltransferase n=1 Tax=Pseudomonas sp. SDI TaxID=2170734 RepID=UPI000DE6AFD0|nr:NeuD/PglB/VioB family sugar acetyltransferase [Pseudomonas sp. SDI]PWB36020.1 acetyltransferase [Pseudomonas sp. SDI]
MNAAPTQSLPLVLLGAGGHAKVLLSLVRACGHELLGVCDPGLVKQGVGHWRGLQVLGGDEALEQFDRDSVGLINGIGQVVGSTLRRLIFEQAKAKGFHFPVLVHPTAWIDESVVLGEGAQVMAGAILQPDVMVGCNTVVNTRASLDHDCCLAAHVHVAPAATLCGGVHVSIGAFVGSGSTVIQGIAIGEDAVVGAGTVVVRDVPAQGVLIGPPARLRPVSGA